MASNIRVRINPAGARAVLNSSEVQAELLRRANLVKERAESFGSGKYDADVQAGKTRAHALVKTKPGKSSEAYRSRRSNAKHNSIAKSIDAAKGNS